MDEAAIPYCVLRHYEGIPDEIYADVDCVVPRESELTLPQALAARGLRIVQDVHHGEERDSHRYTITHDLSRADRVFSLDVCSDYGYSGWILYSANELLKSRRRHKQFWVLAPDLEFACYLVRKVAKAGLDEDQERYLSELYERDPNGCRRQIERWWRGDSARCLAKAAETGDWSLVKGRLRSLRSELRWRAARRNPLDTLAYRIGDIRRRLIRWLRPTGLLVAFLGPDGVGKSTIIQELGWGLTAVFRRTEAIHLPPRFFRQADGRPVTKPHRRPPWPLPVSVIKIMYLLVAFALDHFFRLRPQLVHSTLVLCDRYLPDVLVDPRRFRYGGPLWLARLVWWLAPKSDLVILLDAPAEIIHGRKQEVPLDEIVRQREAFRTLVGNLSNGVVVDASRSVEVITADVNRAILEHLAARTAKRLRLEFQQ